MSSTTQSICLAVLTRFILSGEMRGILEPKSALQGRVRCNIDYSTCFCVDALTEIEVPGTRKEVGPLESLACRTTPKSFSESGGLLTFMDQTIPSNQPVISFTYPLQNANCKLPRDQGVPGAGKETSIRFFRDSETAACLAFAYLGHGGNGNNFESSSACYSACALPDTMCSGEAPSVKVVDSCRPQPPPPPPLTTGGQNSYGDEPIQPKVSKSSSESICGDDRCTNNGLITFCCNREWEDLYDRSYSPKCPNGKVAVLETGIEFHMPLIGKDCGDAFCPNSTECFQNELFAYCC